MAATESTRLRLDDAALQDALLEAAAHSPPGSACYVLKTATQSTYPTTINAYYHCQLVAVTGTETEGTDAIHTDLGKFLKAYNYGTAIPPVGTYVVGNSLNYGFAFQYVPPTGPCIWTFMVRDNCLQKMVSGALIELKQGGTLIKSCTTSGRVTTIAMTQPGTAYTSVPFVAITGGGGSGATATAVMEIAATTRSGTGGSGYTNGNYIGLGTYIGGGGSGGSFTFSVAGGAVQPSMAIVNRGSGYTSTPGHNFSAAGPGTGASAATTLRVKSLTLGSTGSGYTSKPTVAFSGGGGTGFPAAGATTVDARCALKVPSGSYDVTITPPAGSNLAPKTVTVNSSCSITTFLLDPDASHTCGGCGYPDPDDPDGAPCATLPNSVSLTWTYDPEWNEVDAFGHPIFKVRWPDATLTLGEPLHDGVLNWTKVYYSEPHDLLVGYDSDGNEQHLTMKYAVNCLAYGVTYQFIDPTTGEWNLPGSGTAGGSGGAFHTCKPFSAYGGTAVDEPHAHWRYDE
jgi:hypothetical protein